MEQHIEQLQITLVGSESVEIKGILTFDTFLRRPVKVWTMENVREEPLDLEQLEKKTVDRGAYRAERRRSVAACKAVYDDKRGHYGSKRNAE